MKPKTLNNLTLGIADYYEYSMANANILQNYSGLDSVFDMVVRNLPKTKVIGEFEYEGVKYNQLGERSYIINAGLEQAVAVLTELKGNEDIAEYMEEVQGIEDREFLDWVKNIEFRGDAYAMREGEIFFAQEPQLRVHEKFEEAQVYETLLLTTINPQTNVATTANDIAEVTEGILLEGGSRRAQSPQAAIQNTRAAIIGGFHATSNIAFGMEYREKVGGTHGHSYVMLHETEMDAFIAQADTFNDKVCFLLDTYQVNGAVEKMIYIVKEKKLNNFAMRIDSGDLVSQYKYITNRLEKAGFERDQYQIVASDDLTAGRIADMEAQGCKFDKYLVGTFVVNPPKPLGGVYKLASYQDKKGEWMMKGKMSEDPAKSTLPGIKQVYRISGKDHMFTKDIIALEGESIDSYLEQGETAEPLLIKVIDKGKQAYDLSLIKDSREFRKERLSRLPEKYKAGKEKYPVIISHGIREAQEKVKQYVLNEQITS